MRCYKKLVILVATLGFTAVAPGLTVAAPAQILESLLFAGFSTLLNGKVAKSQEHVVSSAKIKADLWYKGRFTGAVWDTTTQTNIILYDGMDLVIKPFKSGPPPHDMVVYLNDAKYSYRKVEGDKKGPTKGTGGGVIGGYPMVSAKDIPYGGFQIKVRLSKDEWATVDAVRLPSTADVLGLMADEELRDKLSGFNGATFPSVPVFVVGMPDGSIRNFTSAEEAQRALAEARTKRPSGNGNQAGDNAGNCSVTLGCMQTSSADKLQYMDRLTPLEQQLYEAAQKNIFDGGVSQVRLSPKREQAVFVLFDQKAFTGQIKVGAKTVPLQVRETADGYEALVWGSIDGFVNKPVTIVITDANGNVRTITFVYDEGTGGNLV